MNTVKNLPEYANEYKYIVASQIDGDLWFWGAWNDMKKAIRKCREEDNMRNCEIYKLFPNISHTAIDQVLNYKTYKKIPC